MFKINEDLDNVISPFLLMDNAYSDEKNKINDLSSTFNLDVPFAKPEKNTVIKQLILDKMNDNFK